MKNKQQEPLEYWRCSNQRDCSWVGLKHERCPKCGSEAFYMLSDKELKRIIKCK